MQSPFTVRRVRFDERHAAVELCMQAFAGEAMTEWTVPDPVDRYNQFEVSVESTVLAAEALVAVTDRGEFAAISFWHELEIDDIRLMKAQTKQLATVPEAHAAQRRETALSRQRAVHPQEPQVFLSSMGTLPQYRGQGAGGAMIDWGINFARQRRLPIYLQATTPQSRNLYLRKGFIDHGNAIEMPDHGPMIQPMVRF